MSDLISRQEAISRAVELRMYGKPVKMVAVSELERLPSAQVDVTDINVGDINKFIDGLEEIFADIRERHVDDSVCGLCEYDGAYMGQSGDWCNECPGFDRDDCFKLSDECRKRWIDTITNSLLSARAEHGETTLPEQADSNELGQKQGETCADVISRQAAKVVIKCSGLDDDSKDTVVRVLEQLPSAQPEKRTEERTKTHACDLINRQAAIETIGILLEQSEDDEHDKTWNNAIRSSINAVKHHLPSDQPERTCVNCGRTANNGGWYADGRTRCPIEEHYALPKDGYCHLWEKRNVTDDDYPERREE